MEGAPVWCDPGPTPVRKIGACEPCHGALESKPAREIQRRVGRAGAVLGRDDGTESWGHASRVGACSATITGNLVITSVPQLADSRRAPERFWNQ